MCRAGNHNKHVRLWRDNNKYGTVQVHTAEQLKSRRTMHHALRVVHILRHLPHKRNFARRISKGTTLSFGYLSFYERFQPTIDLF